MWLVAGDGSVEIRTGDDVDAGLPAFRAANVVEYLARSGYASTFPRTNRLMPPGVTSWSNGDDDGQALYSAFATLLSFTSWPRGRNHKQADQATLRCALRASYRSRIARALFR